jgi:hypothetical protein
VNGNGGRQGRDRGGRGVSDDAIQDGLSAAMKPAMLPQYLMQKDDTQT